MILRLRPRTRPFGLTPRELEVLQLVAEGLSNTQIAAALCLGPQTVKNHLSAAMLKLDAPSRVCALLRAHAAHLVDLDACAHRYTERLERAA